MRNLTLERAIELIEYNPETGEFVNKVKLAYHEATE